LQFDDIRRKLTDGTLERADLPQALALFAHMANSIEALRYEMACMTQGFQFNLGETTCHIAFGGGRCAAGLGAMPAPIVMGRLITSTTPVLIWATSVRLSNPPVSTSL